MLFKMFQRNCAGFASAVPGDATANGLDAGCIDDVKRSDDTVVPPHFPYRKAYRLGAVISEPAMSHAPPSNYQLTASIRGLEIAVDAAETGSSVPDL